MSSIHQDIKDTLESPGAVHIRTALCAHHKALYRQLRDCTPEELPHLQAAMKAIDTALPAIIEKLLNKHLQQIGNNPPPKQEHFFEQFFKCAAGWTERVKRKWQPQRVRSTTPNS